MKKKIHIDYPLNQASGKTIWNAISTPAGLQEWFADRVSKVGKEFTFQWGKTEVRKATLMNTRNDSFIRFHWSDDDEPKTFFEMRILSNELTGDHMLVISDFSDPDEEDDTISLWNSQINNLKRACGI